MVATVMMATNHHVVSAGRKCAIARQPTFAEEGGKREADNAKQTGAFHDAQTAEAGTFARLVITLLFAGNDVKQILSTAAV